MNQHATINYQRPESSVLGNLRIIGADIPILSDRYPIEGLLRSFKSVATQMPDVKLVLAGSRQREESFSVWNYIDENNLTDRVEYLPYYDRCEGFPVKKSECAVWIDRDTPPDELSASHLLQRLYGAPPPSPKRALFFTCFHPEKQEGNSRLMRIWLTHLKEAGYRVHLVYYMCDAHQVPVEMRRAALRQYHLYLEVEVTSRLTGTNRNGLNVHVDDWCGPEALEAVGRLTSRFEYDLAITNYPFATAIFESVAAYTKKILLTHDSFTDRNRRMLAQGYGESGWISLDESGERLACERSDLVVALQDEEAEHFRGLAGDRDKVCVISPLMSKQEVLPRLRSGKLRIGYFGSRNWVNEHNLGEFMALWSKDPSLVAQSELFVGGGVCETLPDFVSGALLSKVAPTMVGRVEELREFFSQCDLIVNPERGGTGIKIKTLEAMAHGMPVLTTRSGAVGIPSKSRFHQARDLSELVELTSELVSDPALLGSVRKETAAVFDTYLQEHFGRMEELLGAVDPAMTSAESPVPSQGTREASDAVKVPAYVRETAAEYHIDLFANFLSRVDVRGKRVLEIGSDYHMASARLFAANGASTVVGTNISDWSSPEPLPEGVEFRACDVADADLPDDSFDIVYGIAILEHIPDLERVCVAIKRFLRPGGIAYLQGCPLWPGPIGHHVWCVPNKEADFKKTIAKGGAKKALPVTYAFTDRERNPIPDWAHLALPPEELVAVLVAEGVPETDAAAIVTSVFNTDGSGTGSCSNFMAASEILQTLGRHFDVSSERVVSRDAENAHFLKARERYSEKDLRTLGLNIWLRQKRYAVEASDRTIKPTVSIIIPFYNVEQFIGECLSSVVDQDYPDLEILLIDDASPDRSREVVNRFAAKDPRINLITHQVNLGLGPARNTGVEHATGAYLLFLDSDDFLSSPQAVSILVREAESSGCKVVVGSCQRLQPDGDLVDFDREFDRTQGGRPGQIVDGEAAYLGASFIPGGQYVPMRAWGTLVERILYQDSGLAFPAGEHEDLPHTPFLYHYAGRVLYVPDIVVTYRQRPESISNTQWGANRSRRYLETWRHIQANIEKFGLQAHLGDAAIKTIEHMLWKLRQNGMESGAEPAVVEALEEMLSNARGELNESLFCRTMDNLRTILDFDKHGFDLYRRLTARVPVENLISYYRSRLADSPADYGLAPVETSADALPEAAPSLVHPGFSILEKNQLLVAEIMDEYNKGAGEDLKRFPSMLTEGDKALYYHAGKGFRFEGAIVDAGCFVGGTTMSLVNGLMHNKLAAQSPQALNKLIRVYDLFQIDDDYILEHLQKNYPDRNFEGKSSFLEVFRENLAGKADLLDVRPGDVTLVGYPDEQPIEVLGVDLCKALPVTDFVAREFFPRLLPGSLVIQQDFIHEYHPHIHISMLKLEDYFEKYIEIKWGGSVAYKCIKPITKQTISERFGMDLSWYGRVEENAALLRKLEREMLYDENRWIILLTICVYYWMNNCREQARTIYKEALMRFPEFEPNKNTRRLIGV